MGEIGRREGRRQLQQGIDEGVFDVPHVDVACDIAFGVVNEAVRRVAQHPGAPVHAKEVAAVVLRGLGVRSARIRQILKLPLPAARGPARA